MVNLCRTLLARSPANVYNDKYWRKRRFFKMAAHFYGRSRNCFSITIRRVQRALQYVTVGRDLRKQWYGQLWEKRITAASQEVGHLPEGYEVMKESLARCNVLLDRPTIAHMAVWEPRTFKALSAIAADKAKRDQVHPNMGPPVTTIKGKLP